MLADSVTSGWVQCSSFGHRLERKCDRFEYYGPTWCCHGEKFFVSEPDEVFRSNWVPSQQFSTTIKTLFLIAVS